MLFVHADSQVEGDSGLTSQVEEASNVGRTKLSFQFVNLCCLVMFLVISQLVNNV